MSLNPDPPKTAATGRRALVLSLVVGILATLGAGMLLLFAYVITGLWLAGHNRSLFGWNGSTVTGIDWPNLVFILGSITAGLVTAALCYRSWRPNQHEDE